LTLIFAQGDNSLSMPQVNGSAWSGQSRGRSGGAGGSGRFCRCDDLAFSPD
jgi:hypothetical protein